MTRGIVPPKIRRIVRTIDGGSRSIGSLVSSAIYYAKKYPKIAQCATPEQIVLETLRCAPPAWTVVRPVLDRNAAPPSLAAYVTEELEEVVISTLLIHHDEKYWQHPDSWLPSRWHQTSPSVSGFMPFGKGTERCFGQSYIFNLAVPLVGRVLPLLDSFCVTEEKAMPDGPLYSVASYELRYCESGS
ncbi:cytochrome P450 [Glutamicibacter ardleyensis]|uniref:cytochrome P450 n=1 Tax=Glutamicibacter ardleyensis TaxID=225894 RepID=UPI003FD176A4